MKPAKPASFFCDWLNISQEFPDHVGSDFYGGRVVSVEGAASLDHVQVLDAETGEFVDQLALCGADGVDYSIAKFAQHRGSFETSLSIRFVAGRLEVRGNPSAYGRLDNLHGLPLDRCIEVYNGVLRRLGLPEFTEGHVERFWLQNEQKWSERWTGATISRVDLTTNLRVGMGNVEKFHQWLASQHLYRSGPDDAALDQFAAWSYSTVYLSESVYWKNVKSYDKAKALEEVTLPRYLKGLKNAAKEGRICKNDIDALYAEAEDYINSLACWCAEVGLSRLEFSLRSRFLKQQGDLGRWVPGQTESDLLDIVMTDFEKIGERAMVKQGNVYDMLTRSERGTLFTWLRGDDVRDDLPKSSFYRVRSSILKKTGYDIAARPVGNETQEFRPVYFQIQSISSAELPSFYRAAA